jgi:hypothetical protein
MLDNPPRPRHRWPELSSSPELRKLGTALLTSSITLSAPWLALCNINSEAAIRHIREAPTDRLDAARVSAD